MQMHWDRFYECPDIFKMGDWWYLVYSDMSTYSRKVQYFKAKTLEALKQTTNPLTFPDEKEGVLDSRAFYAGKQHLTAPAVISGAGALLVPATTILR